VGLLQWQSDYWVRLRDMPELMVERSAKRNVVRDGWKSVLIRWRGKLIGR